MLELFIKMKIKRIEIKNFWGKDLYWDLESDVNILVGINGSGKSTLLKMVKEALTPKAIISVNSEVFFPVEEIILELSNGLVVQASAEDVVINRMDLWEKINIQLIDTFDVTSSLSERSGSLLDKEIQVLKEKFITYQRNYITKKLEDSLKNGNGKSPEQRLKELEKVIENQSTFFKQLNILIKETGKTFDEKKFNFTIEGKENPIEPKDLSAGEKQLFIILLKVFLQEKKEYILLLDEPELSLHISWQEKLLNILTQLNPNCQFLIVTHSPTIFYLKWEQNFKKIENLKQHEHQDFKSKILTPPTNLLDDIENSVNNIVQKKSSIKQEFIFQINTFLEQIPAMSLKQIVDFLTFLQSKNIYPNRETFNFLIRKTNSFEDAYKTFKQMDKYKLNPDFPLLNALLKKSSSVAEGIRLIKELTSEYASLSPNILSYSILLGKARNLSDIRNIEANRKYHNIPLHPQYQIKLKSKS